MIVKQKATNRKTGKTTTSYKKLTPITKSQFNSNGASGKRVSRPLVKGAATGATTSGVGSIKKKSTSGKTNLPLRSGTAVKMSKLPYNPKTGRKKVQY